MLIDGVWRLESSSSNSVFDTNIEVNRLTKSPTESVTAKPRIGPVPNWKRNRAAIRVVMFESHDQTTAHAEAGVDRSAHAVFPTLISSLMRSKIRTLASTAMAIESTMPAIPGSVRVAPK